jgi:beta-galactosidase
MVWADGKSYPAHTFCDLIHLETASTLAVYKSDFYAGRPALTCNRLGSGRAYYIAARLDTDSLADFYGGVASDIQLKRNIKTALADGLTVQRRSDGSYDYLFIMNFTENENTVTLDEKKYTDIQSGESVTGDVVLASYGVRVLKRAIN